MPLTHLPSEILCRIVEQIHSKDVSVLRLVNKHLYFTTSRQFTKLYLTNYAATPSGLQELLDVTAHPLYGPHINTVTLNISRLELESDILLPRLSISEDDSINSAPSYNVQSSYKDSLLESVMNSDQCKETLHQAFLNISKHRSSITLGIKEITPLHTSSNSPHPTPNKDMIIHSNHIFNLLATTSTSSSLQIQSVEISLFETSLPQRPAFKITQNLASTLHNILSKTDKITETGQPKPDISISVSRTCTDTNTRHSVTWNHIDKNLVVTGLNITRDIFHDHRNEYKIRMLRRFLQRVKYSRLELRECRVSFYVIPFFGAGWSRVVILVFDGVVVVEGWSWEGLLGCRSLVRWSSRMELLRIRKPRFEVGVGVGVGGGDGEGDEVGDGGGGGKVVVGEVGRCGVWEVREYVPAGSKRCMIALARELGERQRAETEKILDDLRDVVEVVEVEWENLI